MTRSYSKSIARSTELKKLVERRWGSKNRWFCVYCGRGAGMVIDHFKPSTQGGTDDIWNLVPACDRCNASKSDRDPGRWMIAVGVPLKRRAAIQTALDNCFAPPPEFPIERLKLDYQAAKALKRPNQGN